MSIDSEKISKLFLIINNVTDLLAEFIYVEVCQKSRSSFNSYVRENLNDHLKRQCNEIEDIFELDLGPLAALCRNIKTIIVGMKLIKSNMFFSYLSVAQSVRNKVMHQSRSASISREEYNHWILNFKLMILEFPVSLRKIPACRDLMEMLNAEINNQTKKAKEKKQVKVLIANKEPILNDKVKTDSDESIKLKIKNLESLREKIINENFSDSLHSCILSRKIMKKIVAAVIDNSSIKISNEKEFSDLVGIRLFRKVSDNQKIYISEINKITNA